MMLMATHCQLVRCGRGASHSHEPEWDQEHRKPLVKVIGAEGIVRKQQENSSSCDKWQPSLRAAVES